MKKIIQPLVILIFLGASFFVVYNFFILPQRQNEQLKQEAGGGNSIDVQKLITRSFKTEQTDILEDERFQSLTDNSVILTPVEELKPGKKNPFVAN